MVKKIHTQQQQNIHIQCSCSSLSLVNGDVTQIIQTDRKFEIRTRIDDLNTELVGSTDVTTVIVGQSRSCSTHIKTRHKCVMKTHPTHQHHPVTEVITFY